MKLGKHLKPQVFILPLSLQPTRPKCLRTNRISLVTWWFTTKWQILNLARIKQRQQRELTRYTVNNAPPLDIKIHLNKKHMCGGAKAAGEERESRLIIISQAISDSEHGCDKGKA